MCFMKRVRVFRVLVCLTAAGCGITMSGCASMPLRSRATYALEDLYRRISYVPDGRYRVVSFFYATSRLIDSAPSSGPAYRPELGPGTAFGSVAVSVDPGVKIGTMQPALYKKRGVLGVKETASLAEADFYSKIGEAVAASPHRSLLVLVFGYKDGFEANAMKAAYFTYLLDMNTPVLLFDWPGDQPVSIEGYKKAQANAIASGPRLAAVLERIIRDVRPAKLWVEGSSMGCQVICDAFEKMHEDASLADAETEIDHVILAAPDVGANEFSGKFKDHLTALSRKVTAYVSSDDNALLLSGFLNGDKRLGRQTIRSKDPEQLHEAKALLYLHGMDPDRFTVIDVTPVDFASFGHGYYLEAPEFYDDFYMRLFGAGESVNRRLYLLQSQDGADYWVMQDEGGR